MHGSAPLAKSLTSNLVRSPELASRRVGCSPTNSRARHGRTSPDWWPCSVTPVPGTPSSSPPLTALADPSPRSPGRLPNWANVESYCAPCEKGSPHRPGAPSLQSWPLLPSWSSSWAESDARPLATPVAPGDCQPPSRRSSVLNGRSNFGVLLLPVSPCVNWLLRLGSGGRLRIGISPRTASKAHPDYARAGTKKCLRRQRGTVTRAGTGRGGVGLRPLRGGVSSSQIDEVKVAELHLITIG